MKCLILCVKYRKIFLPLQSIKDSVVNKEKLLVFQGIVNCTVLQMWPNVFFIQSKTAISRQRNHQCEIQVNVESKDYKTAFLCPMGARGGGKGGTQPCDLSHDVTYPLPPPVNRQMPAKTLPSPNFVCGR